MIHELSKTIADYFFDNKDQYSLEVYVYGIELVISSLLGTLLTILIGIVTGCLVETLIYMVMLTSVRVFSGGYHASTYVGCNVITFIAAVFSVLVNILIKTYLSEHIISALFVGVFILLLSTIIIFCPVENKNKPIYKEDIYKYKFLSIFVEVIQFLLCFILYFLYDFDQVLIIIPAMFVVDISILAEIIFKRRREKHGRKEKP